MKNLGDLVDFLDSAFERSVIGKHKNQIHTYLNKECYLEMSNGSIKARDIHTDETIYIMPYNNDGIVVSCLNQL